MTTATQQKVRGTRFYIGGKTSAATPQTDATWKEIKGAKALGGTLGTSWGTGDATVLTDTYKQSFKTIADAGSMDIGGNYFADGNTANKDPGQAALQAAALDTADDDVYNFKAVQAGNGMITYFVGRVTSFETPFGANTNLREFKSKIMFIQPPAEAAAA